MPQVVRLDAWSCRVPLDSPIRFRWGTITHRDYGVLRLTANDGTTGSAFAISRGLPIDVAIADMLAPSVVGHEGLDVAAFQGRAKASTAAGDQSGILANARSLIDSALWDIRGKAFGQPVWRLLGGARDRVGVLLVEGYELPGETDEDFARRLADRSAEGYPALKLEAAGYDDMAVLRRRLERIRELAPTVELIVDVNGAWRSVREATEAIRAFGTVDLAWVEDPFPRQRLHDVGSLRGQVDVALAAGDDVTSPRALMQLVEDRAVDVLRIDALTLGGISPTADVIGHARQNEVPVSSHAYPTVQQHLSFAWPDTTWIEAFPDELPFEPSHRLMERPTYARIEGGHLAAPLEPGLALELRDEALEATALRHTRVELASDGSLEFQRWVA